MELRAKSFEAANPVELEIQLNKWLTTNRVKMVSQGQCAFRSMTTKGRFKTRIVATLIYEAPKEAKPPSTG